MIKHNSVNSVISPYNPIVSLNPKVRRIVNKEFIAPILDSFFENKGGRDIFEELDPDKIKTEKEFEKYDSVESYVKTYLYKELMNSIQKNEEGKIQFKPRYVISFDQDLTNYKIDKGVNYGELRLGNVTVLYFIYIDFQELIRFIKNIKYEFEKEIEIENPKYEIDAETKRNKLIDELVAEKYRILLNTPQNQRDAIKIELDRLVLLSQQKLQGNAGKLRVNLSWNTTDDLDLHIITEGGVINFQNKTLEYQGVIGKLDVDANASNPISNPQENINWETIPQGKHIVSVDFYGDREKRERVPFTVFIENGEESRIYNSYVQSSGIYKTRQVVQFEMVDEELQFSELVQ